MLPARLRYDNRGLVGDVSGTLLARCPSTRALTAEKSLARARVPDRSCSNITQGLRLGLESCDKPLDEQGESSGQTIQMSFPDALKHMLKETGYKIED